MNLPATRAYLLLILPYIFGPNISYGCYTTSQRATRQSLTIDDDDDDDTQNE